MSVARPRYEIYVPAQTQTGAQGIHNDRGQGIDTDVTLNQGTVQPTAQRTYSQVAISSSTAVPTTQPSVPATQPRTITTSNQASAMNPGIYATSSAGGQGLTPPVIPGNIPHYRSNGQGAGRPVSSAATIPGTGNNPRFPSSETGNQGQLNNVTNDRNGSVNATGITGQSQTVHSGRDQPSYTNL